MVRYGSRTQRGRARRLPSPLWLPLRLPDLWATRVAHAVWLDFNKPFNLGPDRCSKLVFVRYRLDLEPWVAGTRAPDDLDRYEEYLAVAH